MERGTRLPSPFTVAWLLLAASLCAVIALWGIQLTGSLGAAVDHSSALSVPRPTTVPSIQADYTGGHTEASILTCAELTSRSTTVTVDSATGIAVANIPCATVPPGATTCLYRQSSDGMLIVLSQQTGSLLTPAQAANCTK